MRRETEVTAARGRRRDEAHGSRRRLRIALGILILVVLAIVAAVIGVIHVYTKAMSVQESLSAALPLVRSVQDDILSLDTERATTDSAELTRLTNEARAETDDPVWRAFEAVPVIGPNLSAIRAATEVTDDVATGAIAPFAAVSLEGLKPRDGRIDVSAITGLAETMTDVRAVIDRSEARISAIDDAPLLSPVAGALDELRPKLVDAKSAIDEYEPILQILPDTFGASGTRNYLILFQNNAEAQALGGGTASMMLLTVDDGVVEISEQASSLTFPRVLDPGVDVDPSAVALFGENMTFDLNTSTSRPDFPTAASIATQFWERFYPERIDGVLAIDPVALSYLLDATGPIPLDSGDTLTATNAVSLLLNEVYFRFQDSAFSVQNNAADEFFADTSAKVFTTLMSGSTDVASLVPAISRGIDEDRILAWSSEPDEQELLAGTPIAGILPTDNTEESLTGVFYRDASVGSKIDYYLDTSVAQSSENRCSGSGTTFTTSTTLTSKLTAESALRLPDYVSGVLMPKKGDSRTEVFIYGPVGTSVESATLDGAAPDSWVLDTASDLGRPVAHFNVFLSPGQSVSLSATFSGEDGEDYGPVAVQTTPMINPTTVEIDDEACGG